jgi:hypothetical protein
MASRDFSHKDGIYLWAYNVKPISGWGEEGRKRGAERREGHTLCGVAVSLPMNQIYIALLLLFVSISSSAVYCV